MGVSQQQIFPIALGKAVNVPFTGTSTPGTTQTIIDSTVPSAKVRRLHQVVVICRMSGKVTIELDTVVIGSGRTGPGESNMSFVFGAGEDIAVGQNVKVKFLGNTPKPAVDLEGYLQMSEKNA